MLSHSIRVCALMPHRYALASLLFAASIAHAQEPSVRAPCPECGTIISIREIRTEREAARLLPERAPSVGPFIQFSLGDLNKPRVGGVGDEQMRERLSQRRYEVTIRFDDERYGLVEVSDASAFMVGDRVHVHQGRIEHYDIDFP
jgi:hypothetical protein